MNYTNEQLYKISSSCFKKILNLPCELTLDHIKILDETEKTLVLIYENNNKYAINVLSKLFFQIYSNITNNKQKKYDKFYVIMIRNKIEKYTLLAYEEGYTDNMLALAFMYNNLLQVCDEYFFDILKNKNDDIMINYYEQRLKDIEFYYCDFDEYNFRHTCHKKMLKFYNLSIKSNCAESMFNMGIYYKNNGDYDEMKKYYLMAINNAKNNDDQKRYEFELNHMIDVLNTSKRKYDILNNEYKNNLTELNHDENNFFDKYVNAPNNKEKSSIVSNICFYRIIKNTELDFDTIVNKEFLKTQQMQ